MKKLIIIATSLCMLSACEKDHHKSKVYKTPDGNYYTQDDNGNWLMLYMLMNQSNQTLASGASIPSGKWVKATTSPSKSQIEESEEEGEASAEEGESSEESSSGDNGGDSGSGDAGGGDSGGGDSGGGGGE